MPEPEGRGVRVTPAAPRRRLPRTCQNGRRARGAREPRRSEPAARSAGRREVLHAADLAEGSRRSGWKSVLELGPAGLAVGLTPPPPSLAETQHESWRQKLRKFVCGSTGGAPCATQLVVHEEGQAVVRPAADLRRHRGHERRELREEGRDLVVRLVHVGEDRGDVLALARGGAALGLHIVVLSLNALRGVNRFRRARDVGD